MSYLTYSLLAFGATGMTSSVAPRDRQQRHARARRIVLLPSQEWQEELEELQLRPRQHPPPQDLPVDEPPEDADPVDETAILQRESRLLELLLEFRLLVAAEVPEVPVERAEEPSEGGDEQHEPAARLQDTAHVSE